MIFFSENAFEIFCKMLVIFVPAPIQAWIF